MSKNFKWVPTEKKEWFILEWINIPESAPKKFIHVDSLEKKYKNLNRKSGECEYKVISKQEFREPPYFGAWGTNGIYCDIENVGIFGIHFNHSMRFRGGNIEPKIVKMNSKRFGLELSSGKIFKQNVDEINLNKPSLVDNCMCIHSICEPVSLNISVVDDGYDDWGSVGSYKPSWQLYGMQTITSHNHFESEDELEMYLYIVSQSLTSRTDPESTHNYERRQKKLDDRRALAQVLFHQSIVKKIESKELVFCEKARI